MLIKPEILKPEILSQIRATSMLEELGFLVSHCLGLYLNFKPWKACMYINTNGQ